MFEMEKRGRSLKDKRGKNRYGLEEFGGEKRIKERSKSEAPSIEAQTGQS